MFENVDGRTDARVICILMAHLGAFGSGELKNQQMTKKHENLPRWQRAKCQSQQKISLLLACAEMF